MRDLDATFHAYDQLDPEQQAAVDEMRCLPVPELRRLVGRARAGRYASDHAEHAKRHAGLRTVPLPSTVRTPCGMVLG